MDRTHLTGFPLACVWMIIATVAVSMQLCITQYMLVDWTLAFLLLARFGLVGLLCWGLCFLVDGDRWPFFLSPMLFWRVICFLLCQALLMLYLMHAKLLDATLLFLSTPLWTPFLSRLFFGQSCNRFHILSLLLGFVGVAWMLHPGRSIISAYVVVGLMSGVTNACGQVLAHRLSHGQSVLALISNVYLYSALGFMLFWPVLHAIHPAWLPMHVGVLVASPRSWWLIGLILVSLIIMGGRLKAYSMVSQPAFVMPFIFLAVPCSAGFDWFLYHQMPTSYEYWGAVFIFLGCLISIFAKPLMARYCQSVDA